MTTPAHPSRTGWDSHRRGLRAAACEALEPRRLFIAAAPLDVVSVAHGGASTGDAPTGTLQHAGHHAPPAALSDDGRFVAFASAAGNLSNVPLPAGTASYFYFRDRVAGTTRFLDAATGRAEQPAETPAISGDGRYVVYTTTFPVGGAADVNGFDDVHVYDAVTGAKTVVSVAPAGAAGGGFLGAISRDGRYVAFVSDADVVGDGLGGGVFRRDLSAGATVRVNPAGVGFYGGGAVDRAKPQVSDDGNVIAWRSPRTDDRGFIAAVDVSVRDMTTGVTQVATVGADGSLASDPNRDGSDSDGPAAFALSGDGRHVAFVTRAAAVPQDTNGVADVYVRDVAAAATALVSAGPDGAASPGLQAAGARSPAISRDGRIVAFTSDAVLTTVPDTDPPGAARPDVYVRDVRTGVTQLASADVAGTAAAGGRWASLSADGRRLAFSVVYDDRFAGPPPAGGVSTPSQQVLVMDTLRGQRTLAGAVGGDGRPVALDGALADAPVISRDGSTVAFAAAQLIQRGATTANVSDGNGGADLLAALLGPVPAPPAPAAVVAAPVSQAGTPFLEFTVTWTDATSIDVTSLGDGDVVVSGPNGYRSAAAFVSVDVPVGGATRVARYRAPAPGELLEADDNGNYAVEVAPRQVFNAAGVPAPAGTIPAAAIAVNVPLADGPDLRAALSGSLPASVVAGSRYRGKPLLLTITNHGNAPAAGPVVTRVLASAGGTPGAATDPVLAEAAAKVNLAPGRSKRLRVKPKLFPAVADGDYRVVARLDAANAVPEQLEDNNVAALAAPVRIAAPHADVGVVGASFSGRTAAGGKATLLLTLRNEGNQDARGVQPSRVRLTADPANPAAPSRTFDLPLKLNVKPGATRTIRTRFSLPGDLAPGTYFLFAELLGGAPWSDPDATDDTATGGPVDVSAGRPRGR